MLFLLAVLSALPFLFFDFSLAAEPLHYLTIMGPAVHLRNGGTLLVDTFSQYGPGAVLAMLSGFALGSVTPWGFSKMRRVDSTWRTREVHHVAPTTPS